MNQESRKAGKSKPEIGDFVLFDGPVVMSHGTIVEFSPAKAHALVSPNDKYSDTAWISVSAFKEFWKKEQKKETEHNASSIS